MLTFLVARRHIDLGRSTSASCCA
ncbi:putative leader peptide [Streptomyces hainanensis]